MNYSEAIAVLQDECDGLSSTTVKAALQEAIDVLNDQSTAITKPQAMEVLNNVYFDATLIDAQEFGISTFVVSRATDPVRPFPKERPH